MKYIVLSVLMIICAIKLYSQSSFIASYPISFPIGDHHNYIGKTSFRGINLEFLHRAKPGIAVGVETGWNVFYEKVDKKDYKDGNTTISGVQHRYTNAVPILAETKFYPNTDKKNVNAYVGVGVGTLYISRATDFGLYRLTEDAWQFCIRPEVGVVLNIEPGFKAMAGLKYYPAFNSADMDGQSYLSANIGFVFSSL